MTVACLTIATGEKDADKTTKRVAPSKGDEGSSLGERDRKHIKDALHLDQSSTLTQKLGM